ncbi:MAG: hypothetical protein ACK47T_07105 [Brevundimonas sp.]
MADGALRITLGVYAAAKLAGQARAVGVSPAALAAALLGQELFDREDFTWINGDPRIQTSAPADLEGACDWDAVRPEVVALIDETFGPE